MLLTPPADGLVTDLQLTADLAVGEFLIEQFHCLKTALLQGHKVALDTSWITHGGLDAAEAKIVPLYYAKFSKCTLARGSPDNNLVTYFDGHQIDSPFQRAGV